MTQDNKYDSLTRKEKDAYLWWVNVTHWKEKHSPELASMDRKTKNNFRRWRKHNSRLAFESSGRLDARKIGGVNIEADDGSTGTQLTDFHVANCKAAHPMLMYLPQFERWIESHTRPRRME